VSPSGRAARAALEPASAETTNARQPNAACLTDAERQPDVDRGSREVCCGWWIALRMDTQCLTATASMPKTSGRDLQVLGRDDVVSSPADRAGYILPAVRATPPFPTKAESAADDAAPHISKML
jgi:hypothetical protein